MEKIKIILEKQENCDCKECCPKYGSCTVPKQILLSLADVKDGELELTEEEKLGISLISKYPLSEVKDVIEETWKYVPDKLSPVIASLQQKVKELEGKVENHPQELMNAFINGKTAEQELNRQAVQQAVKEERERVGKLVDKFGGTLPLGFWYELKHGNSSSEALTEKEGGPNGS